MIRNMAYDIDPKQVTISSKKLAEALGISVRMISHLVSVTGQEASKAADGRGTRRLFSYQEAFLLVVGKKLLVTGMAPRRIKRCITEIRNKWAELFPWNAKLRLVDAVLQPDPAWKRLRIWLVAWENAEHRFEITLVQDYERDAVLRDKGFDGLVILNLSELFLVIVTILARSQH